MKNRGVYGKTLGEAFRLEQAPTFTSRTLRNVEIGVTHITCNIENNGMTSPLPTDDAYLVTVQLVACAAHDLWIDGKPRKTGPLVPGSVSIYDLRQTPVVNSVSTFENVHFYLPRSALRAVAQGKRPRQPNEIDFEPGIGVVDPVLHQLTRSLLPSFGRPERAVSLFVDHVTTAVAAYVAERYISNDAAADEITALSGWQLRRAQEMLSSTGEEPSISALASACGVDSGMFSKAFEASTGNLPHEWRRDLQIERAKGINEGDLQREFLEAVGISPEGWRYRA